MKSNSKKKLLSLIVATIMMVALMGATVSAAETTYSAIVLAENQFPVINKILDMPTDTNVPTCGFAFSIVPGTAIPAETGLMEVKAGPTAIYNEVTYPKIADVIYAANETKDNPVNPDATKGSSLTKPSIIDFSHVEFTEPGVYRYVITESSATGYDNIGVGLDEYNQRILDVYIKDVNGTLQLDGSVMTKIKSTDTATAPAIAGGTLSNKSSSFINEYPTNILKITKTVAGNQGSKDEYFKFTIKLENTTGVTIDENLKFGITGQTAAPTKTAATPYEASDMATANGVTTLTGAQLKAGYSIYLQHGDDVTISGLVKNCKFNISEESNHYSVTTVLKQEGESDVNGDSHIVSEILDNSTIVEYTNTKTGTIPTGVIVSATGLIIAAIIAVAGVVFFGMRSKRRFEEE
ncbi:MAG: hypothetical protein K6E28_01675 [Eubacterium sp.]|nr:hypothetical protein [Eubacterium sp.]